MKSTPLVLAALAFSSSAFAAGIDSRAYSCSGLHALIAANRFVFIGNPSFQDFVVATPNYCGGGQQIELRSVPTTDNPSCAVNYCVPHPDNERG